MYKCETRIILGLISLSKKPNQNQTLLLLCKRVNSYICLEENLILKFYWQTINIITMTADAVAGRGNMMISGVITTANPTGGSHSALLQKQMSFKTSVGANQLSKTDDIEVIESGNVDGTSTRYDKVSCLM